MHNIPVDSVVVTIVQAMLPMGGSCPPGQDSWTRDRSLPTKALIISVDMRASYYLPEDKQEELDMVELGESCIVHLMFERPDNYTKVFEAIDGNWTPPTDASEWTLKSNHDTCWRSDGVRGLAAVSHDLRNAIRDEKKRLGLGGTNEGIVFWCNIQGIRWGEITYENEPGSSRKRLTSLTLKELLR